MINKFSFGLITLLIVLWSAPVYADLGTELWVDTYDSAGGNDQVDSAYRAAFDSEGNIISCGYIDGPYYQGDSAYVVKYSPDKTILFSDTINAGNNNGQNDRFYEVAVDSEDNIIVVGQLSGQWTSYYLGSYYTAWYVRKYLPDGTLDWQKVWQSSSSSPWQEAYGVAFDEDDNIYVTGRDFGSWSSTAQSRWATIKYDPDGNVLLGPIYYNYSASSSYGDYAQDIDVDQDGNFYVVGYRGQSSGNLDWHVIKYSPAGVILWQDTYSGAANLYDIAKAVKVDENGDVCVAGYTMIKYAAEGVAGVGQRLWTKTYASEPGTNEACYDVTLDSDGDFIVAGHQRGADNIYHRRVVKLRNEDGETLAEKIWEEETNSNAIGVAIAGQYMGVVGNISNGSNADFLTSLLLVAPLSVVPEPADFDRVAVGQSAELVVTLAGHSSSDVTIGDIALLDLLESPFSIVEDNCSGQTLSLDEEATLTLSLDTSTLGQFEDTFDIPYFDPNEGSITVRVRGTVEPDCNGNGIADSVDIEEGTSYDLNENDIPDECDIADDPGLDTDGNGIIDEFDRKVLLVNVNGGYNAYGLRIRDSLNAAGADTTFINLSGNGQAAALINDNYYYQIWVFDLSSASDNYSTDWQAIGDWFNQDQSRAILCDGRMLSSFYDPQYTTEGVALTENYYRNMHLRGGGLLLGTDHDIFQLGINTVCDHIGIERFSGNFVLDMIPVDTANPLMNWPNDMGTELHDNSSPGQCAYGLQANGRILYSVAWHSGNPDTPGISSTIEGAVGFHVDITSPADGSEFLEGDEITFIADPNGGTPFFSYDWSSDIDGDLGSGSPLAVSTLSVGEHIITVLAEDNESRFDDDSITVTILPAPPDIDEIADGLVAYGSDYTGPTPVLLRGTAPVTWSLTEAPDGMTIDPDTGIVSWLSISTVGTHVVTIRAENAVGADEETWLLTVVLPPLMQSISDVSIPASIPYTGTTPVLLQGSHVTFSLTVFPAGMTINSSTGVVSWPNPVTAGSPHAVTIRAENIAGSDEVSFNIEVLDMPVIDTIADESVLEHTAYTGPVPSLLAGSPPVTFSIITAPTGTTINATTGQVSWTDPQPSFTPYTITIRATNVVGYDEESWLLTVLSPPDIEPIADDSIVEGDSYTGPVPVLSKGTAPVTWSLITPPVGMSINPSTGVVSWPTPTAAGSPHLITIHAENTMFQSMKQQHTQSS
jgi:hypothetical protein